jgi:hypothetical protein
LAAPPRVPDLPAGGDRFPGCGGSLPYPDTPATAPAAISRVANLLTFESCALHDAKLKLSYACL